MINAAVENFSRLKKALTLVVMKTELLQLLRQNLFGKGM
jgi:hypothetical protein